MINNQHILRVIWPTIGIEALSVIRNITLVVNMTEFKFLWTDIKDRRFINMLIFNRKLYECYLADLLSIASITFRRHFKFFSNFTIQNLCTALVFSHCIFTLKFAMQDENLWINYESFNKNICLNFCKWILWMLWFSMLFLSIQQHYTRKAMPLQKTLLWRYNGMGAWL